MDPLDASFADIEPDDADLDFLLDSYISFLTVPSVWIDFVVTHLIFRNKDTKWATNC